MALGGDGVKALQKEKKHQNPPLSKRSIGGQAMVDTPGLEACGQHLQSQPKEKICFLYGGFTV